MSSSNKSGAASKLRDNILKDLEDSMDLDTSESIALEDPATSVLRSVLLDGDGGFHSLSSDLDEVSDQVEDSNVEPAEVRYNKNEDSKIDDDKTALLNQAEEQSIEVEAYNDEEYKKPSVEYQPQPEVIPFKPANKLEEKLFESQNLKLAQSRIEELEKEVENLRKENQTLMSVSEAAKEKAEDLVIRVQQLERSKSDLKEQNESELEIFRQAMAAKENDISKLKTKISELDSQVSSDLRKIRVRERELENRLELVKAEKNALLRSKDESILELKRKLDLQHEELYSAKSRATELQARLDSDQEKFARTVRALRIALTNLEVEENTSSITIAPLKKAE